jgi:tetratricopeptide (TPR) repeat protein
VLAVGLATGLAAAPVRAANEARPAAAATQTSVAQLNEEGAALYASRDYRHAIEKFIQAYAVDSDPNLLFNIARCYEELGEIDAAIEKYDTFLKTPGADARGRARARESLAALKEARAKEKQKPASAEAPSSGASASERESPAPALASADESSSVLPWLMLGGAVAFAAGGTAFYLMGVSDHHQVTQARGFGDPDAVDFMTRRRASDLVDAGKTDKLIGGIGFGVAGALAATYVVLALTGDHGAPEEQHVAWSVAPARSGGSIAVHGSF